MKMNKLSSSLKVISALLVATFGLSGCEDIINLETARGPELVVVDGWITNQPGPQKITLSLTGGYFDNAQPKPVLNADVVVKDNLGNSFLFKDLAGKGEYVWAPVPTDTL